jgi:hypothetical protein
MSSVNFPYVNGTEIPVSKASSVNISFEEDEEELATEVTGAGKL